MTTTTSISLEFGMPVSPVKFGVEPMKWLMTKLDVSEIHSRRNEWEVNDFNLNNLYILKSISGRFLYLSHDLYEFMRVIYSLFIVLFIYIWTSVYTCTYLHWYTHRIYAYFSTFLSLDVRSPDLEMYPCKIKPILWKPLNKSPEQSNKRS